MAHCRCHHGRKNWWLPESCSFLYVPCTIRLAQAPRDKNECWRFLGGRNEKDRGLSPASKVLTDLFSAYHSFLWQGKGTDRTKKVPPKWEKITCSEQNSTFYQKNEGAKCTMLLFCYFGLIILRSSQSHTKNWFCLLLIYPLLWMKQLKPRGTN